MSATAVHERIAYQRQVIAAHPNWLGVHAERLYLELPSPTPEQDARRDRHQAIRRAERRLQRSSPASRARTVAPPPDELRLLKLISE